VDGRDNKPGHDASLAERPALEPAAHAPRRGK
jgi:hypothetical protein